MENKKISFGFSKVSKKPEIISKPIKEEKQVELIECLEGQSIKIKDAIEEIKQPLIIPIKESTKNLIDRVKEAKEKRVKNEIKEEETEVPDSELSIDELAARELLREAQNRDTVKNESKVHTLPIKEEKLVIEGEEEPSLEDYENVPISDYGMAMLRGMGWKEGMPIGKTQSKTVTPVLPELRPKGLGLGANKMANKSNKTDKDEKELQIVKGGFGKVVEGKYKGHYCEIQGLDIETSRCIIKITLTNEVVSLHEFLIKPVTKQEYALGSKVLNNAKYEEYKEKSSRDSYRERSRSKETQRNNGKHRSRSRERSKKKKERESKSESGSDSENDYYKNDKSSHNLKKEKIKKSGKSSKTHRNEYLSDSEDERKKKSKKKHRSRNRSRERSKSGREKEKYDDRKYRK